MLKLPMPSMSSTRGRGFVLAAVVCFACASVSACGSRLSDSEVLAQNAAAAQPSAAEGVGGASTSGVGSTITDPAVSTTIPGAVATTGPGATAPKRAGATVPAGSGSGPAASGGTGGSAKNGPATGSVVNVGQIGLFSGLLGSILGTIKTGTQVSVAYMNANGGLNGHRINLITADDGGDPATGLSIAQKMIDQDRVIAFVNNLNPLSSSTVFPYIAKRGVAIIGGIGLEAEYYTSPLAFPGSAAPRIQGDIAVKSTIEKGASKVGILYCAEFNILCSTTAKFIKADVPKFGGEVVFDQQVSIAQPDYTSQCLSAKAAGVNNFLVAFDPNSMIRLVNNCASQDYYPQYSTFGVILASQLTQAPAADGMLAGGSVFPFSHKSAATAAFHQAFEQVTGAPPVSNIESTAWVGGLILQEAGRNLPAQPTAADVLAGLHKIRNNNFGGLASAPISYFAGRATQTPTCAFIIKIDKGEFTAPQGLKPNCLPTSFAS